LRFALSIMASTLDQVSRRCHDKFFWETRFDVLQCTTVPQGLLKNEADGRKGGMSAASGSHFATKSL
jgi:hypothetical protein